MNHLPMPTKYFTLILLLILFSYTIVSIAQLTMMGTCSSRRATAMSRELEEIRLMNKKNHQAELQLQEDKEQRKKDAAEASQLLEEASKLIDEDEATQVAAANNDTLNFTKEVCNITDGIDEMESEEQNGGDDDARSPLKKCTGSRKASSCRSTSARQVSPNKSGSVIIQQPTSRTTSFLDTFDHKYKRTILEQAILLTSKKKFEEFTQALMAFLTNAQMVDPKCVINPLNPESKSKDIVSKGEA